MKVRKEKIGYIVLVHNYTGDGTMVTSPTALHGKQLTVVDGLNELPGKTELKNLYPIYVKYPDDNVILNINKSNDILSEQGKPYRNVIHKCIIPKGSNIEKFIGGHIVGENSKMFLSDKVFIDFSLETTHE